LGIGGTVMLGYTKEDLDQMSNAVHDAKLFYIMKSDVEQVDKDPLVEGLLKANDFLQGLWAEGYFD
jgi:hypothetical protein